MGVARFLPAAIDFQNREINNGGVWEKLRKNLFFGQHDIFLNFDCSTKVKHCKNPQVVRFTAETILA